MMRMTVGGKQPCALHLPPSQHHQRDGGLWWYSTLMMYVNTNVKMQKHILSFYYYTWQNSWFLVIIPADILQWFKEVRRWNFFCKILYFLKKIPSCFIQTLFVGESGLTLGTFRPFRLLDIWMICLSVWFEPHIFCLYYFLLKVFILRSHHLSLHRWHKCFNMSTDECLSIS